MTIDIHAHVIPEPLINALADEVPAASPALHREDDGLHLVYRSGRRSGPVPLGMIDVDSRLADMDRMGVRTQALSVPPMHFLYQLPARDTATAATLHNDAMIQMAHDHPDRFVVLGTLPMQNTELALSELRRLVEIPQVAGVEIGTNVGGLNLDHPSLSDIWSLLDASGLAVVLHPDAVAGRDRMQDHYLHNLVGNPMESTLAAASLVFGGVLNRNPSLRIALLHGGGFLPYQIGRLDHGWRVRSESRANLQAKPSDMLDRFWFDTLTHDASSLRFLLDRVGRDRLCLGSDYPFDMADFDAVETVTGVVTDPESRTSVLEGTARSLLTRAARH